MMNIEVPLKAEQDESGQAANSTLEGIKAVSSVTVLATTSTSNIGRALIDEIMAYNGIFN